MISRGWMSTGRSTRPAIEEPFGWNRYDRNLSVVMKTTYDYHVGGSQDAQVKCSGAYGWEGLDKFKMCNVARWPS